MENAFTTKVKIRSSYEGKVIRKEVNLLEEGAKTLKTMENFTKGNFIKVKINFIKDKDKHIKIKMKDKALDLKTIKKEDKEEEVLEVEEEK